MRLLDVRSGVYRDSVRLMQISAALAGLPGVERALVAMATPVNLDLLPGLGFRPPDTAGPDDLLIALVTADDAMAAALERLETELGERPAVTLTGPPGVVEPRTTGSAVARTGAGLVVVSTPGRYAFVEAMDALEAGASVLVFSDNVPVEQEIALKAAAAARGLLVLGPDCGTAVVGGVGLGFANVVRPGPVGLVAASGTGAQQVMSLLALAGVGISHCLGVGGRDLSAEVAGRSTHAALDLLDADPGTELIVLVAKPPAATVETAVREHVAELSTPVVFAPLGRSAPDLTSTVESVLSMMDVAVPVWPSWTTGAAPGAGGFLRGLYGGGTLCVEAAAVVTPRLGPVGSNVFVDPQWTDGPGHTLLDLGADEFTVGRPHPMIDPGPRLDRFAAEAADPLVAVVLLDLVLGHAAHPDPAPAVAAAVEAATRPGLSVVVSLIGTPDDPQGLERQAARLRTAGIEVFTSNARAARRAADLAVGGTR